MKVLQSGSGQKGWSQKATCTGKGNGDGGCGAILLVEQADLYYTYSNHRDETDQYVTFRCPECGVQTDLMDALQFPRNVHVRADENADVP